LSNEDIIIGLIQMDMKHNQLVGGLEAIGLDGDGLFELGVLEIISKLMEVPGGKIDDRFSTMYSGFLKEATKYKITYRTEALRPQAELSYRQLKAFVDYETNLIQSPESEDKTSCQVRM